MKSRRKGVRVVSQRSRWKAVAGAACVVWTFAGLASAKTVYWTNTAATATWTVPDAVNFSTAKIGTPGSPTTYEDGDTVYFGNGTGATLPATSTLVTLAAGGVNPATIYMYTPRGANRITFQIGEDDALGSGSFSTDYNVQTTFTNTTGSEVTLDNDFTYQNANVLHFQGGDFRLKGTVSGGGNGGPSLKPAAGVRLTLDNGVSGDNQQFNCYPDVAGGTIRINGTSAASGYQARQVTIQIGADDVFGPTGSTWNAKQTVTGNGTFLEAVGGARTLNNNFYSRGFTVKGDYDLTLNGSIQNNEGYYLYKEGSGTLTLGGDNVISGWGNYIALRQGVLRVGHTNALGATGLRISGGVVELAAGNFTRALAATPGANSSAVGWVTDTPYGASGGFSASGAARFVNLGGATGQVTWASTAGFVPSGQALIFGSTKSDAQLDFQNPINLNGAVRTMRVNDNTNATADRAVLSGVISGSGASGLSKTGDGTLFFTKANTYAGATTVTAGAVGGTGSLGGNLVFESGAGFVADWDALASPLTVAGSATLGSAATLTVLGTPPSKTRTVILSAAGGVSGTFATVTGLGNWTVDYKVAGEVALKPPSGGTTILIR